MLTQRHLKIGRWLQTAVAALLFLGMGVCSFAKSSIKKETEIGFKISSSFAQKVLRSFDLRETHRTDYYIEAYDGQNYLLHPDPRGLKFRLQVETDENTLQAMVRAEKTPASCPNGLAFLIKDKTVGEILVDDTERKRFSKGVREELAALEQLDSEAYLKIAPEFHSYLASLELPELAELKGMLPAPGSWLFVASHISKKSKWKGKKDFGKGTIALSVTKGREYVGSTLFETIFEVEFESRGKMTSSDFVSSICAFMEKMQPATEDLNPDRQVPWQHSLELLNQLKLDLPPL